MKNKVQALLEQVLSPTQVRRRFGALRRFALSSIPVSGQFTQKWLTQIIAKIDELWYDGVLLPQLSRVYRGFHIRVERRLKKQRRPVAGFVEESRDGQTISLCMNAALFESLFQAREHGYHSGGLLCTNRLDCFLHVLTHETLHLLLTLADRLTGRDEHDDDHHGDTFMRVVHNLFGQTHPQHGLLEGFNQYDDLATLRRRLKPGLRVELFWKRIWIPAVVVRKTPGVEDLCVRARGKEFTVTPGLVRIPRAPRSKRNRRS